ncbi:MAG: ATP-binding cassette domain-containing protein [Gemmatimonadota bacterium]
MKPPILEARELSVGYGAVRALERVSIDLHAGSVTCVMGENGAGKSTLIRVLSGVIQPTAGQLLLDGGAVRFADPRAARKAGVVTVYQDLALVPLLSVWRNFVLGAEPLRGRWLQRLDVAAARAAAEAQLAHFEIRVDVNRPVARLSGGERQAVAIARAVHTGARVLILDEPTAALAVAQADRVLTTIAAVRDRGVAVLLVTHNPQHAVRAADRLVVLKHGRLAAEMGAASIGINELTELMSQ